MKRLLLCLSLVTGLTGFASQPGFAQTHNSGYPITPVPFTSVKVTDSFWGQRLKASREVTIPLAFSKCKETGRYDNFVKAAHPSKDYKVSGYSFDDTDVYKTIEGASYSMQTFPDKKLEQYIDSVLTLVAAAQESDGYLYTARTMNPEHPHEWAGAKRWEKEEVLSHEADPSGKTNGICFWGSSFVAGPQGELLALLSDKEEEVRVVTVDKTQTENVRRWWPFFRDRRIDAYDGLVKRFLI